MFREQLADLDVASLTHHIVGREVAEVAHRVAESMEGAVFVAHNAGFDRAFVNFELGLCGRVEIHETRWVDTLALARPSLTADDAPLPAGSAAHVSACGRSCATCVKYAWPGARAATAARAPSTLKCVGCGLRRSASITSTSSPASRAIDASGM